jgi:NADH-quinone oxidoreductase subunit J
MVVLSKNPVHSILCLVLVFFNSAGLLIILGAEFLAMLFIVVYVGAVAVLFLFVIMLLNIKLVKTNVSVYRYLPLLVLFGFFFLFELITIIYNDLIFLNIYFLPPNINFNYLCFWWLTYSSLSNVLAIGSLLYTNFSLLFIVSGVILLVSMLGAISLTLHKRNDVKKQYVFKQVNNSFNKAILCKI